VSDQDAKPEDQGNDLADSEPGEAAKSLPAAEPPPRVEPVQVAAPAQKRGSSVVGWLALLLVLAMGVAAGWSVKEWQLREAGLKNRLALLENTRGQEQEALDRLSAEVDQRLNKGLDQATGENRQQAQMIAGQGSQIQGLEGQLAELRVEFARYSANDQDSWLLAESEYLLRLANQRLVMSGDAASAQALLQSADKILRELDDPGLHAVRGAVAADLAAVRAVPVVDVQGIYLSLAALIEQADALVIFEMPEPEPRIEEQPAEGWRGRLRQGYEAALMKLAGYVAIRRRDVPMQALMDPQWEGLVRQNLRMLLQQAQVALLSGNQALYGASLEGADQWVAEFFESDEKAARVMAREIGQLSDRIITVDMPDLTRSLGALDEAIKLRLQQGGRG
jgi:uroporphyrin-3 C-methyltransferase